MTFVTSSWEAKLMALASEGLSARADAERDFAARSTPDKQALQHAYLECADITRQFSRTFFLASGLLPREKRQAARVLYAICRITDDLVDLRQEDVHQELGAWARSILVSARTDGSSPIALAWHHIRRSYQIPARYAEQLIEGVALDIDHKRYATFDDLVAYCYGVASTVGLMAMHIIGFQRPEASTYAVRLGVALQLTNILRDIGEDWRNGRLYLPLNELQQYGLDETDIARGIVDDRWRAFMRYQIQRARQIYAASMPGIRMLHEDGRFSIAAAALLYRAILDEIERNDYNVFDRRACVSTWGKIKRLPWIWLSSL